ncbi:MAG TPA: DUF484 family protein [Woeseiaceae bacterium]|nr:DUF484 family protein [Woeseiaceae bacterium]
MSTQRQPEFVESPVSEELVHDYLRQHPDYFERHPSLLGALQVPHASGDAISLVERQVSVLRQKDLKLERQLKDLIEVARANDVLAAKIHHLALQLLATTDLNATVVAIEEAVRSGLSADQSVLVVFGAADEFSDVKVGRFFRVIGRDDEAVKPFSTFLGSSNPRCGQARDSQLQYLFREDAAEIGSVALVQLGNKSEIGFLAIGSTERDRFHPGMSMDFLARVGDLVAAALKRF